MEMTDHIAEQESCSEADFWQRKGPDILRARKFEGQPSFYPVYRWRDYYSHSPLPLARLKGRVVLNPDCVRYLERPRVPYCPPDLLIDREIVRIGGPRPFRRLITDRAEFVGRIAAAIDADREELARRHPGHTHFVVCGGRDSLNALLLNWKEPVIVLSAEPNYPLVREFVRANGLRFDVLRLESKVDEKFLEFEIADNFCRMDLQHSRWTLHLVELAREAGGKAIFWNGNVGDAYLTPYWLYFAGRQGWPRRALRRAYTMMARRTSSVRHWGWQLWVRAEYERALWTRAASMQGAGLGLARSASGCLCPSIYQGPQTIDVLHSADLPSVCVTDVRSEIGRVLAGREVEYPATNPGPPPSVERANLWSVPRFLESLKRLGISFEEH